MAHHPVPDPDFLMKGRVHEAVGPGRRTFALALASAGKGAVLWLQDARKVDGLYPPGLSVFFDPARLILVQSSGNQEILQLAEDALRTGAVPLVVIELDTAPDLTASRRLQLAAGTGGGFGLCLIPEGKLRSNAAETRWLCHPAPGAGSARQHWEVVKNKRGRLAAWDVAWSPAGFVPADAAASVA